MDARLLKLYVGHMLMYVHYNVVNQDLEGEWRVLQLGKPKLFDVRAALSYCNEKVSAFGHNTLF